MPNQEPLTLADLRELEAYLEYAPPRMHLETMISVVRDMIALREHRTVHGQILVLVEEFEAGMRLAHPEENPETLTARHDRLRKAAEAVLPSRDFFPIIGDAATLRRWDALRSALSEDQVPQAGTQ